MKQKDGCLPSEGFGPDDGAAAAAGVTQPSDAASVTHFVVLKAALRATWTSAWERHRQAVGLSSPHKDVKHHGLRKQHASRLRAQAT